MSSQGFKDRLDEFVAWRSLNRPSISKITLAVTERTVRRKLGIGKNAPLEYRGIAITCTGSPAWRLKQQPQPQQAVIE